MAVFLRRGWWKPWNWSTRTWVLAIFAFVVISPFATRWICLWRMPDVAMPFDVEDVIRVEVPKEGDAFVHYERAMNLLPRYSTKWSGKAIEQAIAPIDAKWDERLDEWLIVVQDVLAEYRRGGEMERANGPSLKTADVMTTLAVHQECRNLAKISEIQAMHCERSGDLEAAWTWHRANLRCSIHAEMPGFAICRLIANAIRVKTFHGIVRWAEHQSLTADRLRTARREISAEAVKRMPLIDVAKSEYLMERNTWQRPNGADLVLSGGIWQAIPLPLKRVLLWLNGQPEIRLRLLRQVLLNNAEEIDNPLYLRRKNVAVNNLRFELAPGSVRPGQLDAIRLEQACRDPLTNPAGSTGWPFIGIIVDNSSRLDNARLSALDVVLAAQMYQRAHGEFPATMENLVPRFLDAIPFDPMNAAGAALQYRREENGEAIVWSIGLDAQNNDGDVEGEQPKDMGYRIRLNKQTGETSQAGPASDNPVPEITE